MKIVVKLTVSKPQIHLDYRRLFLSVLKSSLSENNPDLYKSLYESGTTVQKPFAFSVKLPQPVYHEDKILLGDNVVQVTFITSDTWIGIDLYNALLLRKTKPFPMEDNNEMRIISVMIQNHGIITKERVNIKFLSPLVVRYSEKGNKDQYFHFDEEGFKEYLQITTQNQLKTLGIKEENAIVEIDPINAKRIAVKTMGITVPANLGVFQLTGKVESLNLLYQNGIGARKSQGFGSFEVI